jgi:hypothetical protein
VEQLTPSQTRVLESLDVEIERLEKKLAKAQPYINELNRLRQVRRVLLAEKGTTGGGGHPGTLITQEAVIHFMRENGPSKPGAIAEGLGVQSTAIRSHLSRHKDTTYERDEDGNWSYIGREDEDEDEEE